MTVMQAPVDLLRYARLRRDYARGVVTEPRVLRLRSLGGAAVLCRPSQDVFTFKHTFLARFHLPPAPLPPDATIVDLGSNVGYTVADLAHHYPRARVIGVEMDAANFALARANTASFADRVTLIHAAVWTENGVVSYSGADGDDAFHVDGLASTTAADSAPPAGVRNAPARRLGSILDELCVSRVDYLKMDIEGAEGPLLAGSLDWADRVHSMKVEIHPPATIESCRRALEARGFTCWEDEHHPACLCAERR